MNAKNKPPISSAKCWYLESICLGITIGFSEVLLAIYYGSRDMDSVVLAIFMTVPAAAGAITQIAMTHFQRWLPHTKALAMAAVAVQIFGLLLMSSALIANLSDQVMMFLGQCLYWMGGMTSTSPTQEILARDIAVQHHNRFFSRRAMLMTILTLACNILSANVLKVGLTPKIMSRFLLVGACARMLSLGIIAMFAKASATKVVVLNSSIDDDSEVSIIKLSIAMMVFRCAVNISSPFFSAYMLREIHMTYYVYSFLTAIPLIAKTLCLTNWARLLDDNRKFEGLALATLAIGTTPLLWSLGENSIFLGSLQVVSGLSWAGFDLISVLLIQHMYPQNIVRKLGLYLALSSLGGVMGGLLGGFFLRMFHDYHLLFLTSGSLRLATGCGLLWYLRRHHLFRFQDLKLKSGLATIMTVRPSIEAAAKILPISSRKNSPRRKSA